jgi:hypothetical protein
VTAELLAEHVRRVVAAAPPLTPEQRDKIAALLRPSARTVAQRAAADRKRRVTRPGPAHRRRPDAELHAHPRGAA